MRSLGWSDFFSQQLSASEQASGLFMRVFGAQRNSLLLRGEQGQQLIPLAGRWFKELPQDRPTIGDWLLVRPMGDELRVERRLQRSSVLQRVSPGGGRDIQLLGANVDVLFVVTSCNQEFNARRLERYLAFAFAAGVQPVLVLTKPDTCPNVAEFEQQALALQAGAQTAVPVVTVNGKDVVSAAQLQQFFTQGQTVALLGSSGVGKSTLLNALLGKRVQATAEIRIEDGKGRHTTTDRSLHLLPLGGLVLDSPGIRELQVNDTDLGVQDLFDDVASLAAQCKFRNCGHRTDVGCAIQAAIANGVLDAQRLASFEKLQQSPS